MGGGGGDEGHCGIGNGDRCGAVGIWNGCGAG